MKDLLEILTKLEEKNFYLETFEKDESGFSITLLNVHNHYLVIVCSYCCIFHNDIDNDTKHLIKTLRQSLKKYNKVEFYND